MAIKANLLKSIWSHDPILINPLQHHFSNVDGYLVPFFFVRLFFDVIFCLLGLHSFYLFLYLFGQFQAVLGLLNSRRVKIRDLVPLCLNFLLPLHPTKIDVRRTCQAACINLNSHIYTKIDVTLTSKTQ